jgi:hypothetical protein
VLATDQSDALYLRGRRKQALRTNLSRCRAMGIVCSEVGELDDLSALRQEIVECGDPDSRWADWEGGLRRVFVARRGDGALLTVASLTADRQWAWLEQLGTVPRHADCGIARYALHFHTYQSLRDDGVRWLWAGSALSLWPGLQYFQYLLGFDVFNLMPRRSVRSRGRRSRPCSGVPSADPPTFLV